MSAAGRLGARRSLHRLERVWASGVCSLLDMRLDVGGLEHVDPGKSYVVAPLHEGFADAVALMRLPLALRFVVRQELVEWRVLGRHLRSTDHVVVKAKTPRTAYRDLLRKAPAVLDSGDALVVFPQGSILGVEVAFQMGAFRLADRLGVAVLPVVITGTHRVWEYPYSPQLRFGQRVSVRVLEPLRVGEAFSSAPEIEHRMKRIALSADVAPARRFDPDRDGFWDGYAYEIDPVFPELRRLVDEHRSSIPA